MRTIAATILIMTCSIIEVIGQSTVPRHNVFFAWNSKDLTGSTARVVESVYGQVPKGGKVRFGIEGPISNAHGLPERNMITTGRATSIAKLLSDLGATDEQIEIVDLSARTVPTELVLEVVVSKVSRMPECATLSEYMPLPVQFFEIDPRKDNLITGELGTVIHIPAKTLCASNGQVPPQMQLELTEVYGQGNIIQADLHTQSGGRMLETAGTILLEAFTNGRQARVAQGKEFEVRFAKEDGGEPMETFVGRTDRSGRFDWVPRYTGHTTFREEFYLNGKQISKEEYEARIAKWEGDRKVMANLEAQAQNQAEADAYLMKSGELGWINCDRFVDEPNTTELAVSIDTAMHPTVRMVFDDIKSVMAGHYDPRTGKVTFSGVPVGRKVRLVGYSIMDGNPYMAVIPTDVRPGARLEMRLTPTTRGGLETELASLN
jgi:hypothetical protein